MPDVEFTPDNLSEKSLRYGYWFVTHKIMLERIGIIILIVFDAATVGWSGWNWLNDYVLEANSDRAMAISNATSVLSPDIITENTASSLLVSDAQVFTTNDTLDFTAEIKNPNANFRADFTYRFTSNGAGTAPQAGFALPGDDKYLTDLGQKLTGAGQSAVLEITNIVWRKIDRHTISDYKKFAADRLNFVISDIKFTPTGSASPFASAVASTPTSGPTGKTTFTLYNNTGFGYHSLKFNILLYTGPGLAAVNSIVATDVAAGETREIEVSWYQSLPAISDTRVIPEVDIMNNAVYLR